jgi:hypothetical protein
MFSAQSALLLLGKRSKRLRAFWFQEWGRQLQLR